MGAHFQSPRNLIFQCNSVLLSFIMEDHFLFTLPSHHINKAEDSVTRLGHFERSRFQIFLLKYPKYLDSFCDFCEKWHFLEQRLWILFGNSCRKLGYFSFQHLVTLAEEDNKFSSADQLKSSLFSEVIIRSSCLPACHLETIICSFTCTYVRTRFLHYL